MTNADKIRSMSDKELYLFLSNWFVLPCQLCRWWNAGCCVYPNDYKNYGCAYSDEYEAWETWLKQESE